MARTSPGSIFALSALPSPQRNLCGHRLLVTPFKRRGEELHCRNLRRAQRHIGEIHFRLFQADAELVCDAPHAREYFGMDGAARYEHLRDLVFLKEAAEVPVSAERFVTADAF